MTLHLRRLSPPLKGFMHQHFYRKTELIFTQAESAWDIPYLNRKIFLLHYQILKSDFFLSLTFPISLSDFTIELLSKNLITKWEKLMTKKI